MGTLVREINFAPAWDKRDPEPRKNCGVHGVELRMYVSGPEGAVNFILYTNWHLPHVAEEFKDGPSFLQRPLPADLGYHSRTPHYDGQTANDNCQFIGGAQCYYDGSALNADRIFQVLLREGIEGVWRELEIYYYEVLTGDTACA